MTDKQFAAMRDNGPAFYEALIDIRNRILCPVGPAPSLDLIAEIAGAAIDVVAKEAGHAE